MEQNTSNSQGAVGPPLCIRCNKLIYDGTIFQMNGQFLHGECLKCVICRKNVTGCCHMKNNDIYCRDDFIRLFGAKCASCNEVISPSDLVHVANSDLYHTACFSCITCRCQLQPGSFFYVKEDGKLICSSNCHRPFPGDSFDTDSGSDESGSDDTDTLDVTSINDNQLRMLTEAYQSNKRPPRSLRKKMSAESGLSVRTIQIWFHNRRSKDKNLCKNSTINYYPNGSDASYSNSKNNNNNNLRNHPYSNDKSCSKQNRSNQIGQQTQQRQHNRSQSTFENYQLYCPLDFLVPNEMPPNIDLSSADICNGEVVVGKRNTQNFNVHQQTTPFFPDGGFHWLTA